MADSIFISLILLIQHPDTYDGKTVRVVGLCSFKFESKAIWISKDDLQKGVTKNAVWLDVKLDAALIAHNGQYMLVEGVFNAKKNGHLGMYSGTIEEILRLEAWERDSKHQ
jgi:hypothetical protein